MSNRILIVDDDRAIAQLTSIWLQAAGFETKVAFDGHDGLSVASSWAPELVLLDIRMPDLDGFEVAARMKDDPQLASIPFIFLSANVQESARNRAMAAGAAAFLAKPFEADHVLRVVQRTVGAEAASIGEESHHD